VTSDEGLETDLTGELAVATVGRYVMGVLRWAFRAQPILDYGIDAQVEIKAGAKPTGRLLALQIKGGPSWFNEPTEQGWIFRPKPKHVDYWLNGSLPVFVVLVDIESDTCYWEYVTSKNLTSTGKGYKLTIPRTQTIDAASSAWLKIVADKATQASDRYNSNLQYLPPSTVRDLERAQPRAQIESALLAMQLSDGRSSPEFTVQALLAAPPSWLQGIEYLGWKAIADFAAEHGLGREVAQALERAARHSQDEPGRLLALAGIHLIHIDKSDARSLLEKSSEYLDGELITRIGTILLETSNREVKPFHIPYDLDLDSKRAATEPTIQEFLALQARRLRNESEAIRRYGRALELRPDSSGYMIALAESFSRRAITPDAQDEDIGQVKKLSLRALEQRRRWDGDSIPALIMLLKSFALQGDYEQILKYGRPLPDGEATAEEARDIEVAGKVLFAAKMLDSEAIVAETLDSLRDQDGVDALRLEFTADGLSDPEKIAAWRESLARSIETDNYELILASVTRLAFLGVDATDALDDLIERGIVDHARKDVASALVHAAVDFEAALPRLRSLADNDPGAADVLISRLVQSGDLVRADEACVRAYQRMRIPDFLISRVSILRRAGRVDEAEGVAVRVIADPSLAGLQRARLFNFLAEAASDREDWSLAESYLRSGLELLESSDSGALWNMVRMQLNQREEAKASGTILRYRLEPRDASDAESWLRALVTRTWDNSLVEWALALANRFSDDVALSSALLGHIVFLTRSVEESDRSTPRRSVDGTGRESVDADTGDARTVVNPELRKQAFAALTEHAERHGAASPIRLVSSSPDELISQVENEFASRDTSHLREIVDAVSSGRAPAGLISAKTGRSYAVTVLQSALGLSVASAFSDEVNEAEISTAHAAFGGTVVTEASALILSSSVEDIVSIRGHFSAIVLATPSRDDITRATVEARGLTANSGSLGWSEEHQRVVFYESSAKERERLWRRAELLDSAAKSATLSPVAKFVLLDKFDDVHCRPWAAPIELAYKLGVPLWSDDLALRHLARSVGVAAFGTVPAVEATIQQGVASASGPDAEVAVRKLVEQQQRLMERLLAEKVVDIPVHIDDLIAQAAEDDWLPEAAAIPISRAPWWHWQVDPMADLERLYTEVRKHRPDSLTGWQTAAMIGAVEAWKENADAASVGLAAVALFGYGSPLSVPAAREAMVRADELANRFSIPSPRQKAPYAAILLNRLGRLESTEGFVAEVLRDL
jgi:tetratricopeptide (TPR) repeat protein